MVYIAVEDLTVGLVWEFCCDGDIYGSSSSECVVEEMSFCLVFLVFLKARGWVLGWVVVGILSCCILLLLAGLLTGCRYPFLDTLLPSNMMMV